LAANPPVKTNLVGGLSFKGYGNEVDYVNGLIYNLDFTYIEVYGINITVNSQVIASYPPIPVVVTPNTTS
jgi:hypothetical protein